MNHSGTTSVSAVLVSFSLPPLCGDGLARVVDSGFNEVEDRGRTLAFPGVERSCGRGRGGTDSLDFSFDVYTIPPRSLALRTRVARSGLLDVPVDR